MSEDEEWYTREIAPKLLTLCNQCADRGMSFISTVEIAPSERSIIKRLVNPGLAMIMEQMCSNAGVNIDGYIIGLLRYLNKHQIEYESSIVLSRFKSPPLDKSTEGGGG